MTITDTPVGDLVVEQPLRARLFEQHGIDYCCGGRQSLGDASSERGLDPATVAVMLDGQDSGAGLVGSDWSRASLAELCDHIVQVHHAYLARELPRLSYLLEKCERAHGDERPELRRTRAVFEQLRRELEAHMTAEETDLFPACLRAEAGEPLGAAQRSTLEQLKAEHAETRALLEALSHSTSGYDMSRAMCKTHRATLAALADLERDLHEHIHEENNILFPRTLDATA